MHSHLSQEKGARVVIMVPLRDNVTRKLVTEFKAALNHGEHPLECLEEHTLMGQDDWDDNDQEAARVQCWWAIFGRI